MNNNLAGGIVSFSKVQNTSKDSVSFSNLGLAWLVVPIVLVSKTKTQKDFLFPLVWHQNAYNFSIYLVGILYTKHLLFQD
jgi:hypothetical protein